MLKQFSKKTKILLVSLVAFCFFIFLLLISKPQESQSPVSISNFRDTTSAPSDYKTYLENTIWSTIKELPSVDQDSLYSAKIRDNSLSDEDQDDFTITSFLVDIDSLHYTFKLSFAWSKSSHKAFPDPAVSISCPSPDEIIYEDFTCPLDPIYEVKKYLPHEEKLSNGTQINITLESPSIYQNSSTSPYLLVTLPTCDNYSQLTESKSLLENWLKSLHLDYQKITYKISCTYCPLNDAPSGKDLCQLTNNPSDSASLFSQLPYADSNFKIEPLDPSSNKIKIILFIDRSSSYYPDRISEAEQLYLDEAINWIKSRGFNPSDYPYETITEQL